MDKHTFQLDETKWFNMMISHLPMIFYALDNKGMFLLSEGVGLKKLGLAPGQVVGMSSFDVYKDFPDIVDALERAISGETVYFIHQVGDLYVENYMVPQLDENGNVDKIICAAIDICDRVKAEQALAKERDELEQKVEERTAELKKKNEELQESYEKVRTMQKYLIQSEKMSALGNLVAGVAHEINTPIGIGVTAASHLNELAQDMISCIRDGHMDEEKLTEFIEDLEQASSIILKNLDRAGRLVKSFKQVSSDQASEPRRSFLVKQYLDEIIISLSPKLNKTKLNLSVYCDPELEIDGYPGAFAQIISNLVINSIMHAFTPGQRGTISISVEQQGELIGLKYSDDGCGVEEEDLGRIFDPFFTTKRSAGGTGLGLSVVYNLVTQQFGGTIDCESQPGKGTQFTIRFRTGGK